MTKADVKPEVEPRKCAVAENLADYAENEHNRTEADAHGEGVFNGFADRVFNGKLLAVNGGYRVYRKKGQIKLHTGV